MLYPEDYRFAFRPLSAFQNSKCRRKCLVVVGLALPRRLPKVHTAPASLAWLKQPPTRKFQQALFAGDSDKVTDGVTKVQKG